MTSKKPIYTIPASCSFIDELVKGLWAQSGEDFGKLSEMFVLMPSRRACRSLSEAFLRFFDGKPSLLPQMTPLGDINEDELQILSHDTDFIQSVMALPPSLSSLKRTFLIAPLLLEKSELVTSMDQAIALARELGQFLDEIVTEGANIEDLKNIVPDNMAEHWQKTLSFLQVLFEDWPAILKANGVIDPAERRNRIIEIQSNLWAQTNPDYPIIVAGVSGSIPAAAKLIQTVLSLPNGQIILPAVDVVMDEASWNVMPESHPQFGFKKLFSDIGITRHELSVYPFINERNTEKERLISEVMRPSDTSDQWMKLKKFDKDIVNHFEWIEAENDNEEALCVALILREALEVKNQTASLVTPDRNLARRISSLMKRWNINVDDTGGVPLHQTQVGSWLHLTAQMIEDNFSALSLLNVVKHPFAGWGMDKFKLNEYAYNLDKDFLRGQISYPNLDELIAQLNEQNQETGWLTSLKEQSAPFTKIYTTKTEFSSLIHAHIALAENLATSADIKGKEILWRGDDGETAAQFLAELYDVLKDTRFHHSGEFSYAKIFKELMLGYQVRAKYGTHSKLSIMGLMESRLVHSDVLILSGLNEAVWPPEPKIDPFLSRKMRMDAQLPTGDKAIGMAAHDFVEKFGSNKVFITRSLKSGGAPTVPSRWLLRLETVLEKSGISKARNTQYISWARDMDRPEKVVPLQRPMPKPSLQTRPLSYSVSSIAKLMKNPYGFYAEKVLGLRKCDPIGKKPDTRDKGNFIHAVMEEFCTLYPDTLDDNAKDVLLEIGERKLPEFCNNAAQQTFWWQRFKQLSSWVIEVETEWRNLARVHLTEKRGETKITDSGFEFTLHATADRIDQMRDGSGYAIVDYKTGGAPSDKDMVNGRAPQLPLEALIVEDGGYQGIRQDSDVVSLQHWILKGTNENEQNSFSLKNITMEDLLIQTRDGVTKLLVAFMNEEIPYNIFIQTGSDEKYNDYDHLERVQEWRRGVSS